MKKCTHYKCHMKDKLQSLDNFYSYTRRNKAIVRGFCRDCMGITTKAARDGLTFDEAKKQRAATIKKRLDIKNAKIETKRVKELRKSPVSVRIKDYFDKYYKTNPKRPSF